MGSPPPPPFLFLFLGQSCLSNNLAPSPPPPLQCWAKLFKETQGLPPPNSGDSERHVCLGRVENPSLGEGPRKFLLREFFPDLNSPPPPRKQSSICPVAFGVALALLATSIRDWDPGRVTGGERRGGERGRGGTGAAGRPALSQSHFEMSSVLYIQK